MRTGKQEIINTTTVPVFTNGLKLQLLLKNSPDFQKAEKIIDVTGVLGRNLLSLVSYYPEKQFIVNNMAPDLLERIQKISTREVEELLESNFMPLSIPIDNTPDGHKKTLSIDKKWLTRNKKLITFSNVPAEELLGELDSKAFYLFSIEHLPKQDKDSVNQLFKALEEANCPFLALFSSSPDSPAPTPFKNNRESKIQYFDLVTMKEPIVRWSLYACCNLENLDGLKKEFIDYYKEKIKHKTTEIERLRLKLNTVDGAEKNQVEEDILKNESIKRLLEKCYQNSPLYDNTIVTTKPSASTEEQPQAKKSSSGAKVPAKGSIVISNPSPVVQKLPQPQTSVPRPSVPPNRASGTIVIANPSTLVQKLSQPQTNVPQTNVPQPSAPLNPVSSVVVKPGSTPGFQNYFFSNPPITSIPAQKNPFTAYQLAVITSEIEATAKQLNNFSSLLSLAPTDTSLLVETFDQVQQDTQKKLKLIGEKIAKLAPNTANETSEERTRKSSLTAAKMSSTIEESTQPKGPGQ